MLKRTNKIDNEYLRDFYENISEYRGIHASLITSTNNELVLCLNHSDKILDYKDVEQEQEFDRFIKQIQEIVKELINNYKKLYTKKIEYLKVRTVHLPNNDIVIIENHPGTASVTFNISEEELANDYDHCESSWHYFSAKMIDCYHDLTSLSRALEEL